jgi:hypothetical protein
MIQTSGSRVEIIGSRLNFAGTGNGLNIAGGTLRFEGVFLDAPGYDVALETLQGAFADLRLSRIQNARTAWKAQDTTLAVLSDLELSGKERSLDWTGERRKEWVWERIRLEPKVAGIETTSPAPLTPRLNDILPPLSVTKER